MRQCGDCSACCIALAIVELDKPRYQPCAHLRGDATGSGGGCGYYAHRPAACRDYRCLWLEGHLAEDDRPDRLGVIFTATADPAHPEEGTLPMLVEVTRGALDAPRVQTAMREMARHRPVVVMRDTGRRVLGRPSPPTSLTLHGRPLAA